MDRVFLGIGAVAGLTAVALGAFAAHGLKGRLPADLFDVFEVGARYLKGRIALDASMYRTDVKNDIYLFPSEDEVAGSTIEGYFGNIDKTRREGLEASARYYLGQHYFYANYA